MDLGPLSSLLQKCAKISCDPEPLLGGSQMFYKMKYLPKAKDCSQFDENVRLLKVEVNANYIRYLIWLNRKRD